MKRLLVVLMAAITVTVIGCSENAQVQDVVVRGVHGEAWSYPERSYLIFESSPVDSSHLIAQGFVAVPPNQRPVAASVNYPGRFGVGIDTRPEAEVFSRGDVWVILADGRLTAEIRNGHDPDNVLEMLRQEQ